MMKVQNLDQLFLTPNPGASLLCFSVSYYELSSSSVIAAMQARLVFLTVFLLLYTISILAGESHACTDRVEHSRLASSLPEIKFRATILHG